MEACASQIQFFKSLFKGRKNVFALRWEKANKSGYMPAYSYDPYMYRLHKQKGGTFKDYKDKVYLKLDDYQLQNSDIVVLLHIWGSINQFEIISPSYAIDQS